VTQRNFEEYLTIYGRDIICGVNLRIETLRGINYTFFGFVI
jgi:hypothetical protein